MAFRTLHALFSVMLVASAAHGEMDDDVVTVPDLIAHHDQADLPTMIGNFDLMTTGRSDIAVSYDQVVSPETFTFNENFTWALRSLRRPKETLGNAVIMYGYGFNSVCEVPEVQNQGTPAALVVQPHFVTTNQVNPASPYSVTFYKTVADACNAAEVVQRLADVSAQELFERWESGTDLVNITAALAELLSQHVEPIAWPDTAGSDAAKIMDHNAQTPTIDAIPGYLPVDAVTAARFAHEIGEIDEAKEASLIFSVGRLPAAGRGLELWAFCGKVDQCFGHEADGSFASSHFAGIVINNPANGLSVSPLIEQPSGPDE